MNNLTPKQAMFVKEYLVDLNATQAAIRAGYSFASGAGYYVYFLADPATGSIFYVGKGKGKRVKCHVRMARVGHIDNAAKMRSIDRVLRAGLQVDEIVFADGLSESAAYSVERQLIRRLRHHGLTNIAGGTVSAAESIKIKARLMLDNLKSKEEWAASCDPFWTACAIKAFGCMSRFYDEFKQSLESVCACESLN